MKTFRKIMAALLAMAMLVCLCACGSSNSAIEMTCADMEKYSSNFVEWVDVCKGWQSEE